MSTSPDPQAGSREDQTSVPSGRNGSLVRLPITGTVLADRYRVVEAIDSESFAADDLALHQRVIVRKAVLNGRPGVESWRERVLQLASARHPSFLNILDWIPEGSIDFVVTERAKGHSVAELLRERPTFVLEDVLRLLEPLGGALDLTVAFTCHPNSLSTRGLFVETGDAQDDRDGLKIISDWPQFRTKIDVWELVKPGADVAGPLVNSLEKGGLRGLAVQQAALLVYEILGGERVQEGEIKRWFKPVPGLTDAANSILYGSLQGWPLFDGCESFFQALESANQVTNPTELESTSEALPALELAAYSAPSAKSSSMKKRPRRRAIALSTIATAVAGFVGVASIFLMQNRHPEAALLKPGITQRGEVTLESEPSGAIVRLDGSEFGRTPLVRRTLPPGSHQIALSLPSFQERNLQIEVSAGEGQDLGNIVLHQIGGELSLAADLPGTAYEVVGAGEKRFTGVTPAKLDRLDSGSYTVHLRPEGWPEYEETVQISPGQSISIDHPFAAISPPETPAPSDTIESASATTSTVEVHPSNVAANRVRASFETRPRLAAQPKAPLTKGETFKRFDAEWDGKEGAIERQISAIDRRIAVASGDKKNRLKAWKKYLGQRRHYVRELRRYKEYVMRRDWNEQHGTATIFDTIRVALGI